MTARGRGAGHRPRPQSWSCLTGGARAGAGRFPASGLSVPTCDVGSAAPTRRAGAQEAGVHVTTRSRSNVALPARHHGALAPRCSVRPLRWVQ